MEIKTNNYLQKFVFNKFFGKKTANYFRLFKAILYYKLGIEYEVSRFLPKLIKNDDIVFDIGANIGYYACRFSKLVNSGGKVFCFEPVKTNYLLLAKMKRILKLKNVTIFNLALGDHSGMVTIYIPILKDSNIEVGTQASLKWDGRKLENARLRTENVDLKAIDELMIELNLNKLDVIKCDTEGSELEVLKGAYNAIKKHKPLLMIEIDPKNEGLHVWYRLGYSPYYIDNFKLVSSEVALNRSSLVILLHDDKKFLYEKYLF